MSQDSDLRVVQRIRNLPKIKTDIPGGRCTRPWRVLNIDHRGRVFLCPCDGWLPFSVGHVLDFNSVDEIFNSAVAKSIQQTITAGTYEFCDTEYCGVKVDNFAESDVYVDKHGVSNHDTFQIEIGIDNSCNLHCPSCRTGLIFNESDNYVNERISWVNRIYQWINEKPKSMFFITIGANGEPFASPVYLKLFAKEFNPNVKFSIRTNATLAKRHIANLKLLPNLTNILISIDAASKEVYEQVRQPAKWETLLDNIDYLMDLRKSYPFRMEGSFVIQRTNLDDAIPFIKFCQDRDMEVTFVPVANWSSFIDYDHECVHQPTSDLYTKFIQIINDSATHEIWNRYPWTKDYIA